MLKITHIWSYFLPHCHIETASRGPCQLQSIQSGSICGVCTSLPFPFSRWAAPCSPSEKEKLLGHCIWALISQPHYSVSLPWLYSSQAIVSSGLSTAQFPWSSAVGSHYVYNPCASRISSWFCLGLFSVTNRSCFSVRVCMCSSFSWGHGLFVLNMHPHPESVRPELVFSLRLFLTWFLCLCQTLVLRDFSQSLLNVNDLRMTLIVLCLGPNAALYNQTFVKVCFFSLSWSHFINLGLCLPLKGLC